MPNLLKENRFIIILRNFSKTNRLVFTLLLLSVTLIIWLFFFYLPINLQIQKEQLLFKDQLKRGLAYQKSLLSFQNVKKENEQLSKELNKHLLTQNSSQKVLDLILNSLKKNGLQCSEFSPLESKQHDFYKKECYLLKAKGSFSAMISFFDDLEKVDGNVKVKNVEIERRKRGNILFATKLRLASFEKNV